MDLKPARCYAIRQDGARVLYHWDCCGAEQWDDIARKPVYRLQRHRAEAEATFRLSWHGRAKGGCAGSCPRCLPALAEAERRLGGGNRRRSR